MGKNNIEILEEYAVMTIVSETHGTFKIKVDLEDVEKIQQVKWSVNHLNKKKYYVVTGKGILLHRLIMDAPKGKDIDHIYGDTMDNRKSQLRICDRKQNMSNSKHYANNTSGHRGVTWNKTVGKWMAYIMVNYKHKNLGYYVNKEDAINARKQADEKYLDYKNSLPEENVN
ncbi:AP2 domain-containing protein [Bacillus sp. FJAT-22090]|uniref:AP2 domain-containing protein n=1 Tax=Bacillus sp. FJAT-22090 TaxID=1581038 RepID=UPI00119D9418|nr:AP2 domain-containing protein [Bacillus sp. FJAT-22090]